LNLNLLPNAVGGTVKSRNVRILWFCTPRIFCRTV